MKKILPAIVVLIFSLGFAQAQSCEKSATAFSPAYEEFSVTTYGSMDLPLQMQIDDETQERFYSNNACGVRFYIVSDFFDSDKKLESDRYEQILKFASANNAKISDKKIGKLKGKLFEFSESGDFYHRVLAIFGKNRFYIFHTVSEKEKSSEADEFFASIKLSKTLPKKKEKKSQANAGQTKDELIKRTIPIQQIDNLGVGSSNQTTPKNTNQTAPIKILSKPQARYTDLARMYNIQGTVTLKVTFHSNKTISNVTTVAKLPFGLTNNAVTAAGSMTFEPAIKDGVPYSVVKTVTYSFTIY